MRRGHPLAPQAFLKPPLRRAKAQPKPFFSVRNCPMEPDRVHLVYVSAFQTDSALVSRAPRYDLGGLDEGGC